MLLVSALLICLRLFSLLQLLDFSVEEISYYFWFFMSVLILPCFHAVNRLGQFSREQLENFQPNFAKTMNSLSVPS